ncbi:MAG: SDR family oxidoreductase [Proteobacteria bacterium]|nr:SDR family oxidoreductase [Pseudomonadota bacterium]
MTGRLANKVAVITGAASGIGLGTVELFIAEGAFVVAADLQDDKGALLERRFPNRLRYVHCDVMKEADIAGAIAVAESAFGGLDVLFNNAGRAGLLASIDEITADGWDETFAILLRAPALGIKHALPLLKARGGGSIINTASIAGLQAGWGPLAYSVAKAGVIHLSKCAAATLSQHRIRVNTICPGLIATAIFGDARSLPRAQADQLATQIAQIAQTMQPIPKPGLPSDIAEACLFLWNLFLMQRPSA